MNNFESLKSYFSSELILVAGILGLIVLSVFSTRLQKDFKQTALISTLVVLVLSLVAAMSTQFEEAVSLFQGMIALDHFGQFFKVIVLLAGVLAVILSSLSKDLTKCPQIEFYAFLLALTLGLNVMVVSNDMLMMYLSIEMASLVSYIMAGYLAHDKRSEESGLKYVLYGGVASGIMIFGMSLLYGLSGSLNLIEIRQFFWENPTDRLVLFITFIFILAGLGYKMAIAPFHMWSPDVYEGAPMPVTAFLSVASKAAGFGVTIRFFYVAFIEVSAEQQGAWVALKALDWQTLMAVLAMITMTVGNLVALQQSNIKRFLAYSSVAHAGYMLMALASQNRGGIEGIQFYFVVYLLMNLGAFFVASLVANQFNTENMEDYKGLSKQNMYGFFLSFCMAIFLFSLAGLPPFAGFIGKWYVFKAALDAGLYGLAVVGVINSVISLFYYVRLAKFMFIDEKQGDMAVANHHWRLTTVIGGFAVLTVFFGIYFQPIVDWVKTSAVFLY